MKIILIIHTYILKKFLIVLCDRKKELRKKKKSNLKDLRNTGK